LAFVFALVLKRAPLLFHAAPGVKHVGFYDRLHACNGGLDARRTIA
jgi:hypothetical protein